MKDNGNRTTFKDMESYHLSMETNIKDISQKTKPVEKVNSVISVDLFIKVNGKMVLKMGKDLRISKINKDMLEDGLQAKKKGMGSYFILMEAFTREIFQIIKSMEKESITGLVKVLIKDIGFITKNVGLDRLYGRMGTGMKVNFYMIKCMGKENIIAKMG